uniref:Odorant receptor n=1 Tax=Leucinodes orbonalis TaxID=711050 RepID=A0AAU0QKS9_9NEOP|nr:odorant receptor [Leucinodes orbonalis]
MIMDIDIPVFEDFFRIIKLNLWISGIPFNGSKIQYRFYFLYISIVLILIEEGCFLVVKYSPENLLELTKLAPCSCFGLLSVLKILPIALKREKISRLTQSLDALYSTLLSNPKKKGIVAKEMILVKLLLKYFFLLNAILNVVYNFSTLIITFCNYVVSGEVIFSLPYAVIVPFSTEIWFNWIIVYLHSILCGATCGLFLITVDALYYVLTSQICSHLAVISSEINELDESNEHLLRGLVMNHLYMLRYFMLWIYVIMPGKVIFSIVTVKQPKFHMNERVQTLILGGLQVSVPMKVRYVAEPMTVSVE